MSQKIWFLLVLLLVITPLFLLNNAEARSADEPCSYLNPSAFKKDAAGNCIRITPVGVNTSEPCSYLKPEKYQRDPNTGLCHKVTPSPQPQPITPAAAMPNSPSNGGSNYYLGVNDLHTSSQQVNCGPGTVLKNGVCVVEDKKKGGGCLIATAAFGSEMAPQVQFLREIRDNTVLQTESGTSFMTGFNQFYYSFSPVVADYERENPAFKEAVKIAITPMLTSLAILNYVDIDSEEEMLGYGIGIILLNIGMYFVAPAVIIFKIRNRK